MRGPFNPSRIKVVSINSLPEKYITFANMSLKLFDCIAYQLCVERFRAGFFPAPLNSYSTAVFDLCESCFIFNRVKSAVIAIMLP